MPRFYHKQHKPLYNPNLTKDKNFLLKNSKEEYPKKPNRSSEYMFDQNAILDNHN